MIHDEYGRPMPETRRQRIAAAAAAFLFVISFVAAFLLLGYSL